MTTGSEERARLAVGDVLTLRVGDPAHGGSCVARHDRAVVFVRHALPGETVRARVTRVRSKVAEADAVEVVSDVSPHRVPPPCPHAHPGGCGGCDLQHADPAAQRALKAEVVRQQLRRIARLDVDIEVRAVGAGVTRWRTRTRFAVRGDGVAGLRRYRSHDVVALDDCPITDLSAATVLGLRWPGVRSLEVVAPADADGIGLVVEWTATARRRSRLRAHVHRSIAALAEQLPLLGAVDTDGRVLTGSDHLVEAAVGRAYPIAIGGFWQVHREAADTLAAAVRALTGASPAGTAADLYSGAGLFASVLAEQVGPDGTVVAVEGDRRAADDARAGLADLPQVRVVATDVASALARGLGAEPAVVVLDPPRTGAGLDVCGRLAALGPARLVYVACDPAALARDVGALTGHGYTLESVEGYDLFPMTHHVECVALLTR